MVSAVTKLALAGVGITAKGKYSAIKEKEALTKSKELIDHRTQAKKDFADYNLGLRISEMRDKREDYSSRLREEYDLRKANEDNRAAHAERQLELEHAFKMARIESDKESREKLLKQQAEIIQKHDEQMSLRKK